MASQVKDVDRGFAALMKALEGVGKGSELTVGLHAEDADGAAMEAAELNEFGSPGGMIPARPAITGWADDHEAEVLEGIGARMKAAIKARKDPAQALEQLAQKCAGDIQAGIAAGIDPPNAEATIRIKGSSVPLIDTGTFRSSIAGKVRPK